MTEKHYKGVLELRDHSEGMDILFLGGDEPLAERIRDDMDEHGAYLSVRYYLANKGASLEKLEENEVRKMAGDAEAQYDHAYSEVTGYLWTDEEIKVGGHDLLEELKSAKGKYCHLIIGYSKTPPKGRCSFSHSAANGVCVGCGKDLTLTSGTTGQLKKDILAEAKLAAKEAESHLKEAKKHVTPTSQGKSDPAPKELEEVLTDCVGRCRATWKHRIETSLSEKDRKEIKRIFVEVSQKPIQALISQQRREAELEARIDEAERLTEAHGRLKVADRARGTFFMRRLAFLREEKKHQDRLNQEGQ